MKPTRPLPVVFYKSEQGNEPVKEWLKELTKKDRKTIGEDIKTVQYGWPLGMPLIRKLDSDIWEIRIKLTNTIARVIFTTAEDIIVLLHGFIKKTQKTPSSDLMVSKKRMVEVKGK